MPYAERVRFLTEAGYEPRLIEHFDEGAPVRDLLAVADIGILVALLERFEATAYAPYDAAEQGWDWGRLRLFMGHIAADKAFVHEVAESFLGLGISSFVAHDDIAPTHEWQVEIEKRLRSCDCLAAFLTPTFPQSQWTDQETGFALFRQVLVVPVRMGIDPYGFVGRYQGVQGVGKTGAQLASELFGVFVANANTYRLTGAALVNQMVESDSYDDARDRWTLVRNHVREWTEEMLGTLEMAVLLNSQVREANFGSLGPTVLQYVDGKRAELGMW